MNSNVLIGNVPSLPIAADGNMPLTINPQCSQGFIQFSFEGNNYLTQATGATHSLLGVWTLYGNGIDSGSPANTVVGINTFTLNPQLQANLGAFEHFLEIGQSSIVSGFGSGGTPTQNPEPYTYTWYNGIVTGGYDQLQFSVTPPFPIPQQPAIGHPPKPMFWYQNPGNTLTITPYVWNALNPNGFFAVSTGNTLAIRAGNETALPAFVPSTFTVSSNRSDLSLNLPGGAYAPQFNPSSQVVYNLDAYSLVQSNTLAAGTVYAATTPYVINDLLAKYVGVNVVVTNDGISTGYGGSNMIYGFAIIGMAPANQTNPTPYKQVGFALFQSMPVPGSSISYAINSIVKFTSNGLQQGPINPLFYNISYVALMAPPMPAPGITVSIYDSTNTMTPVTDTGNNLLLATFSYNGPELIYNVSGKSFMGSVPAFGSGVAQNLVSYTGENSIPVNMILTANTAVDSSIPTDEATYFTYNVPEIVGNLQPPSTYLYINLTNASQTNFYPLYSLARIHGPVVKFNAFYYNPATNTNTNLSMMMSTARGSIMGPQNPMSMLYYMATNDITYQQNIDATNTFVFNALATNEGPSIFKFTVQDNAANPETESVQVPFIVPPPVAGTSTTVNKTTLHIGQQTMITVHLQGGSPPYTGYWNIIPPQAGVTLTNSMLLTLPTNVIQLLVNVTSSNTLLLVPTMGSNTQVAGGRNNTLVLSISNNDAYLTFPSFGGSSPPPLLLATGLPSNTVFGLWTANALVNGTDPFGHFTVVQNATSSVSASPTSMSRGQASMLTGNVLYGSGSFTYKWYIEAPGSSSYSVISGATGTTYNFQTTSNNATGTYSFVFQTTDTGVSPSYVVNASATVALTGGGGGGSTSSTTTTAASTSSTTAPTTTTTKTTSTTSIPVSANVTVLGSLTVPPKGTQNMSFGNGGASFSIMSTSGAYGGVNYTIANVTPMLPVPPPGFHLESSGINATFKTGLNITINVTLSYNCKVPSGSIAPFEYLNGTWKKIVPFTVNATACTMTFQISKDPVFAIFSNYTPSTTTVSTTTATTTTTATAQAQQQPYGSNTAYAAIAVIVVIILIVVAYYAVRKKR